MTTRKKRVLFVDDEPAIRATLPAVLEQHGFEVRTASTVSEALNAIGTMRFDVLLSDLNIGEPGDGFTVVSAMRRTQPEAVTFIITGYPDFETALTAIRNQVDDYLTKPTDVDMLVESLKKKLATKTKHVPLKVKSCATLLRENLEFVVRDWLRRTKATPELEHLRLSDRDRLDHVPDMLEEVIRAMETRDSKVSPEATAAAEKHGQVRFHQGYTIPQVVKEARVLQRTIADLMQTHLLALDISVVIPGLITMSESINAQLEQSLQAYLQSRNAA